MYKLSNHSMKISRRSLDELANAAKNGNDERVFLLLTALSKRGQRARKKELEAKDDFGRRALHFARDKPTILMMLLADGADPRARDKNGDTPLHGACSAGNLECVRLLIGHGADINAENLMRWTPLHFAVAGLHNTVARHLIDCGAASTPVQNGTTALHCACSDGNLEIVKSLCEYGLDVNQQSNRGNTPLHFAVNNGHHNTSAYLLICGARPDLKNKDGKTPMDLADACSRAQLSSCKKNNDSCGRRQNTFEDASGCGKSAVSHYSSVTRIITSIFRASSEKDRSGSCQENLVNCRPETNCSCTPAKLPSFPPSTVGNISDCDYQCFKCTLV